ncbi:hypothetical protein FHX37_3587 [Haloactinospora alba]|uniref:Uncharacterized protein n=1 Tax=Haloactinospora alba TaxID=405555 RepID=A0A543NP01_9ACTN|nr:hypothetical protein FHX37_3587 [Haloactinospora alba]
MSDGSVVVPVVPGPVRSDSAKRESRNRFGMPTHAPAPPNADG